MEPVALLLVQEGADARFRTSEDEAVVARRRGGVGMMQKPAFPVDRYRSSREGPVRYGRSSEVCGPMAVTTFGELVLGPDGLAP